MSEATMRRDGAVTMSLLNFCPGIRREVSSAQQLELLDGVTRVFRVHSVGVPGASIRAYWDLGSNRSPEYIAVIRSLQGFIEGRISEGDLRSLAEEIKSESHEERGRTYAIAWVDDFLRDHGAPIITFARHHRGGLGGHLAGFSSLDRAYSCAYSWLKFVRPGSDLLVALALARTRKRGRFAQLKALVLTENGASILAAVRMARALDLLPQMSVEARQLGCAGHLTLEKIT